MISDRTIEKIWHCKREIIAGEKLLADMETVREQEKERGNRMASTEPTLNDAFGRRQHLELGVPSGENGHRLFRVSPDLAACIIRTHIKNKTAELEEANEMARAELA